MIQQQRNLIVVFANKNATAKTAVLLIWPSVSKYADVCTTYNNKTNHTQRFKNYKLLRSSSKWPLFVVIIFATFCKFRNSAMHLPNFYSQKKRQVQKIGLFNSRILQE